MIQSSDRVPVPASCIKGGIPLLPSVSVSAGVGWPLKGGLVPYVVPVISRKRSMGSVKERKSQLPVSVNASVRVRKSFLRGYALPATQGNVDMEDVRKLRRTAKYQRLRRAFLEENPLCEECQRDGKTKIAEELDHIKPIFQGGNFWDTSNWQSLCSDCHGKKTRLERKVVTTTPEGDVLINGEYFSDYAAKHGIKGIKGRNRGEKRRYEKK